VASVAYAAGIINQSFYAALVMLAIVTSLLAGSWLAHIPKEELLAEQPVAARPLPWRARKRSSPEPSDP
jgi:hypothetical protein